MYNQMDHLQKLHYIAYSEILVEKTNPIYLLLEQRKVAAQKYLETKQNNKHILMEYVEHCNQAIKEQFYLW